MFLQNCGDRYKFQLLKGLKKVPIQNSNSKDIKNKNNDLLDIELLKKVRIGLNDLLNTIQNYK